MSNELDTTDDVMMDDAPAPKTRGLGRGLNALFEDEEVYRQPEPSESGFETNFDTPIEDGDAFDISDGEPETGFAEDESLANRIVSLGIEQVVPNENQPRKTFDDEALNDLASSIREHGIIQPILVRPNDTADTYDLVAGERRWRAAQMAQLHEVPVIVIDEDEAKAYEISLIENLQREELNPMEEAFGYNNLMVSYEYTQGDVANKVGKSRSHVANMLRLMQLPDSVQDAMASGQISMGHGRAILGSVEPEVLLQEVLAEDLSVRETEKRAADSAGREIGVKKSGPSKKSKPQKDVNTLALENDLSEKLGMAVTLDVGKDGSGAIKVNYRSLDQLDEIISRLCSDVGAATSTPAAGSRLND